MRESPLSAQRVTIQKYPSSMIHGNKRLQEGHRSSSGGYAESPPDLRGWTEEERRRRRKTFSLDFLGSGAGVERSVDSYGESVELSPTPSHRHRPRGKSTSARSPHKNNRKRDATMSVQQSAQQQAQQQQQQQQISRSPQKEDWRVDQGEDGGHVPTSDDSSCSHHYHMHHHHHHHLHREGVDARHRRTRESPRRKTTGYVSTRRRSNEVIFERDIRLLFLFYLFLKFYFIHSARKILSCREILICISKILEIRVKQWRINIYFQIYEFEILRICYKYNSSWIIVVCMKYRFL